MRNAPFEVLPPNSFFPQERLDPPETLEDRLVLLLQPFQAPV